MATKKNAPAGKEQDLLETLMARLRSGKYGFCMAYWCHKWPDRAHASIVHELDNVSLAPECKTTFCIAGHLAHMAGYSPVHYDTFLCKKGKDVESWNYVAAMVWKKAYPKVSEMQLVKLQKLFSRMDIRSLPQLRRLLKPLAVK